MSNLYSFASDASRVESGENIIRADMIAILRFGHLAEEIHGVGVIG